MEKHWGDPHHSQPREDISNGERIAGLVWLTVGAALSFLLEMVYLGSRITIAGHTYIFPITIFIAAGFNYVLVTTALLWTKTMIWASMPAVVWTVLYFVAVVWPSLPGTHGTTWIVPNLPGVLFLIAGVAGAGWPLMGSVVSSMDDANAAIRGSVASDQDSTKKAK
ncbi:hypothetical protein ACGE24_03865 [Corynebacterium kroppenstedtii]|uniref:hypothetical protein n=1 Tax=Corynebacterium sp. PCR 32 TaxID=3351342 RepID=UPI003097A766